MSEFTKILAGLAPAVVELVVALIRTIRSSSDPERAAKRLLEESVRLQAFDEAMRRRKRKARPS